MHAARAHSVPFGGLHQVLLGVIEVILKVLVAEIVE